MSTTTLRTALALGALIVALTAPPPAAATVSVTINGPSSIWVPYGQCQFATWTATTSKPIQTYSWSWDSVFVSSNSGYSEVFCSPEDSCVSSEYHGIELVVLATDGDGGYDSHSVSILYEAGTPETGGCGVQICCGW